MELMSTTVTTDAAVEAERPFNIHSMDGLHTVLYAQITDPFYTYTHVPWILDVRKEVVELLLILLSLCNVLAGINHIITNLLVQLNFYYIYQSCGL